MMPNARSHVGRRWLACRLHSAFACPFASLSNFQYPRRVIFTWRRVLVIAPHPDDESLAAGGLILRALAAGASVQVVIATDGEFNHWPQRYVERRWRIDGRDRQRWGALRRTEALEALAVLGVAEMDVRFLGLPDNRLRLCGPSALLDALEPHVRKFSPDLIVSPSNCDLHSDHRVLAQSVEALSGAHGPFDVLTYVTHGAPDETRRRYVIEMTSDDLDSKRRAILCHSSQLALSRCRMMRFAEGEEVFYSPGEPAPRLAPIKRLWEIFFPGAFLRFRKGGTSDSDPVAFSSSSEVGPR